MDHGNDIIAALDAAEAAARRDNADHEREHREWKAQWRTTERLMQRTVTPNVRPTTVAEYAAFVRGYLRAGGTITYVRDRNLSGYYTATADFTLPPLFGAQSINVLVPEGIVVTRGGWGHSAILYMDGFRLDANHGLEMFADVAAYLRRSPPATGARTDT